MNGPSPQFDELGPLLAALCDGQLEPEQAARLEEIVRGSDAAGRLFRSYMQLHGELYWEHAAKRMAATEPDATEASSTGLPVPRSAARRVRSQPAAWAVAAAALALVAASLWLVPWLKTGARAPLVAALLAVDGAEWADTPTAPEPGQRLAAGRKLVLNKGLAQIDFECGATVLLEGPAAMTTSEPRRGWLHYGQVTATVPAQAAGFTLSTPCTTVVDLGTQFGLAAERDGPSEIHVFAGSVQVGPSHRAAASPLQVLRAGRAVRVSAEAGQELRIEDIAFGSRPFVRQMPAPTAVAGSVAAMRALVARHPRLIHHYPFEGLTPQEKCLDRRGDLHLSEVVMFGGRGGGGVSYAASGFDPTTSAFQPFRGPQDGNANGVGLQSQAVFDPPGAMTVELLLCHSGDGSLAEGSICAAVATRADARACNFFVVAVDQGQLVHLMDGEAPWLETGLELAPGEWYYVASTFQAVEGKTRINTYAANLTRAERTLRHVVTDRLVPGTAAASRLGVGKGFTSELAHGYPWSGVLDEVAIYDNVLEEAALKGHLAVLLGATQPGRSP